MRYLLIGGSSYSGQCTIEAIRSQTSRRENEEAVIVSTSSGERQVIGADYTIPNIDLAKADAPDRLAAAYGEWERGPGAAAVGQAGAIAALSFIPARGEVGLPARLATAEQGAAVVDYCIRPMLRMMDLLKPELTVCFSGFITMEPLMQVYGAMTYVKLAMEDFVIQHRDRLRAIRFGLFPSASVRGIGLLVQRNAMRKVYPEVAEMYDEWKASGKKFLEYFYEKCYRFEEDAYRHVHSAPFRPTEEKDIVRGVQLALAPETTAPIVNVLGSWLWTDEVMPELPPIIQERMELMPTDLRLA